MTANSVSARGVIKPKRGKNPVNKRGVSSRCAVCDSINHWAVNCPDATYYIGEDDANYEPIDSQEEHHITLFQSFLLTPVSMKVFISESLAVVILDSAALSMADGKVWVDCYIAGLSSQTQELVTYHGSSKLDRY